MSASAPQLVSLVVWADMGRDDEDAFNAWYDREHMRDRVLAVPGFVRGRRFVAVEGQPKYLAVYDMNDGVLDSPAYRKVADNPDEKTRYFVPRFLNTSRTVMNWAGHFGEGEGSALCLITLTPPPPRAATLKYRIVRDLFPLLQDTAGVICATAMQARPDNAAQTGVATLKRSDRKIDWLLMIESGSDEAAERAGAATRSWLAGEGLDGDAQQALFRMTYRVAPAVNGQ